MVEAIRRKFPTVQDARENSHCFTDLKNGTDRCAATSFDLSSRKQQFISPSEDYSTIINSDSFDRHLIITSLIPSHKTTHSIHHFFTRQE